MGQSSLKVRDQGKTRISLDAKTNRSTCVALFSNLTLYMERYLELMLRRKNTPLTPDKIRYAISQIHSIHFRDEVTGGTQAIMDSTISEKG